MTALNFTISPNIAEASKVVEVFYGNNRQYYMGRCIRDKSFAALEMEAQCYHSLISNIGQTEADDRKGSIEIQIDRSVPLSAENVLAVVLPGPFLDDPE